MLPTRTPGLRDLRATPQKISMFRPKGRVHGHWRDVLRNFPGPLSFYRGRALTEFEGTITGATCSWIVHIIFGLQHPARSFLRRNILFGYVIILLYILYFQFSG
jgi:hypothetical protein